jgi:hypothetical protein
MRLSVRVWELEGALNLSSFMTSEIKHLLPIPELSVALSLAVLLHVVREPSDPSPQARLSIRARWATIRH